MAKPGTILGMVVNVGQAKTELSKLLARVEAGEEVTIARNGVPVACGGWRSHGDDGVTAEVKRMYVAPEARRRGIARRVLAALEDSARAAGRRRIILETGDRQPEAVKLYETAGYERIENFGFYRDSPNCISFGRSL